MSKIPEIAEGVVHHLPPDLQEALLADFLAMEKWNGLTPLARNEWICWIISVKRAETREAHVQRTVAQIKEGLRRPCCWMGCIHRTDKPISASVQYILDKQHHRK